MILCDKIIGKNFKLAEVGDLHLGNIAFAEDKLDETIDVIGTNNYRFVAKGDMIEGIHVLDPRFSPAAHKGKHAMVYEQCRIVAEKFRPIKHLCVAWINGNHELSKSIQPIINPGHVITRDMLGINVPVAFTFKGRFAEHFMGLWTHGNVYVNSMAGDPDQIALNNAIRMKRKLRNLPGTGDCNLISCAHGHKAIHRPPTDRQYIIGINGLHSTRTSNFIGPNGETDENSRHYVMSPSYLKTVEAQEFGEGVDDILTYSERFGYSDTDIGCILSTIKSGYLEHVQKVIL